MNTHFYYAQDIAMTAEAFTAAPRRRDPAILAAILGLLRSHPAYDPAAVEAALARLRPRSARRGDLACEPS